MSTDSRSSTDKKRRLQNACEECRRRKVRCGLSMTLRASSWDASITYRADLQANHQIRKEPKRGPKTGPQSTRSFASHSVKKLVEDIAKGTAAELYDLLGHQDTIWKVLDKLSIHIQNLEERIAYCQREHNHIFSEDHGNTSTEAVSSSSVNDNEAHHSVEELTRDFHCVTFGLPQKTHVGETSTLQLVMTAVAHRKQAESNMPDWNEMLTSIKRPIFWHTDVVLSSSFDSKTSGFEFPDSDNLQILVNGYFAGGNQFCPLLHRPTFEKSIADNLHLRDHTFGALLLAVCANGSLSTNDQYLPANSDVVKSGLKWFQQIPIAQASLDHPLSLHQMQLLCLSVIYLNVVSGSDRGWTLCGIAIRLCQARGAHRRNVRDQSPLEEELWKRVCWTLIFLDTKMSMLYGRPRGISAQEFDLGPLIECDDEYLEAEISTAGPHSFLQPPEKPSQIAFWNCFLNLVKILGLAKESLYSLRKSDLWLKMGIYRSDWDQKAVAELDSALNKWITAVPNHLKWESQQQNDTFFHQSAIIHSMYYWVQIQVHRRFIPGPGQTSEGKFPSLAICMNAARSCIRVIESALRRNFLAYGHFITPLFGSAMILAVNLWRRREINHSVDPPVELADIYRCTDLLQLYESRYILAGRLNDIISTVMSVGHFESSTARTSSRDMQSNVGLGASYDDSSLEPQHPVLSFLSTELGRLSHLQNSLGYTHQATSEELSIFDGIIIDPPFNEASDSLDWDVFMESMDGLLPNAGSGNMYSQS
ncbi:hypothetical protein D9758_010394 [Tetrapyrgos nigripes]|uniref:Xylanolytic transcriptional activator regulatory domain-containing protein n=1 Tax=Tetrapyrgos nigripes TaxID=182062 RepID=A0A8H5D101_9AGAR|nr:hypothetical protein D9758_010394 [Tetrapyrgos nigripes]